MQAAIRDTLAEAQGYNFAAVLDRAVERRGEDLALVAGARRLGYADLLARACGVARMLRARGVQRGDRVAVVLSNGAEFIEAFYGVLRIGAVFVPVNVRLAEPEVRYILEHSGAAIALADPVWAERLGNATVAPVVTAPGTQWADETADERFLPCAPARHDDLQRLMYTSGTTGHPKGVMIGHGAVLWKCLNQTVEFGLRPDDILLASGPLYHVGTLDLPGVGMHALGAAMVVLPGLDSDDVLAAIDAERITCTFLAPSMIVKLLATPSFSNRDLSSLRTIIDGSEKMPHSLLKRIPDAFPNARFFDGFGMTETITADSFLEPRRLHQKLGSVGRPTLGMELRVVDDSDADVEQGTPGELVVRGPKLCLGYWRDREATQQAFRNGWFHTGDVAIADEAGYYTIVDRKKDMISSGGENISSAEVERVLDSHPDVAEVAVVARADQRWGEVPVAFVVTHQGRTPDPRHLTEWCDERLARFKVPAAVHLVGELPRTPSGKVIKHELRSRVGTSQ
jgi:acyl-CoA synthetase (AMP-forming)/AMP-acid ligase II